MSKYFKVSIFGLIFVAGGFIGIAHAAPICPGGEMKMSNGTCFGNPGLAASMRQRGILMNQLKISETALPVAPRQDRVYPGATEFNRFEFSQAGNFSVETNPRSP